MTAHCAACNAVVKQNETLCAVCEAQPAGARCDLVVCTICRKMMPAAARRCNACGTVIRWRWLAVVKEIISIIGGPVTVGGAFVAIFWFLHDYRSHTEFKVKQADEEKIAVKVWNTGHQPSAIISGRLTFDNIENKTVVLALTDEDVSFAKNVIAQSAVVDLTLALKRSDLDGDDVRRLPGFESSQPMTLVLCVAESSDTPGQCQEREDRFLSSRITKFVKFNWGTKEP